jgi:ubiquinone biosynthesis O-methyltransferase
MNPTRVQFIRTQLATSLGRKKLPALDQIRDLRILDVGCGGGLLSESLARLGAKVTAIDPSAQNIAIAREHATMDPLTSSIEYIHTTIEDLASSNMPLFDVICSLEVIEHTNDVTGFLQACTKCLLPSGSFFLSTMNRTQKSYWLTIVAAEKVFGFIPHDTHHWEQYITPQELQHMLESNPVGCQVLTVKGLVPDLDMSSLILSPCLQSIIKHWKVSDDDMDVNYILHSVKKLSSGEVGGVGKNA